MGREKVLNRLCGTCKEYNKIVKEYVKSLVETGDYNSWAGLGIVIDMALCDGSRMDQVWSSKVGDICEQKGCSLASIYNRQDVWKKAQKDWKEENKKIEDMNLEEARTYLKEYYISLQTKKKNIRKS